MRPKHTTYAVKPVMKGRRLKVYYVTPAGVEQYIGWVNRKTGTIKVDYESHYDYYSSILRFIGDMVEPGHREQPYYVVVGVCPYEDE